MSRKFVLVFISGEAADLNATFVRPYGTESIIEVPEDTYNFLYNSLIETSVEQQRRENNG